MSTVTVTEILASFGFETDDKSAKAWGKSVDNLKSKMGGAVQMGLKVAVGLGAVATGIYAITKATATAADEAIKNSRRTGMTVQAYQEIEFAAAQSGIATEVLNVMLQKQGQILGQAGRGDQGVVRTIKDLGLNVKELLAMSPDKQLQVISEQLSKISNPTKKAALAAKIYGESWSKAATLMEGGEAGIIKLREQAKELGFVVGEEAAKSAEEFNDSIQRLTLRLSGLRNRIGFALMPILQNMIHRFDAWWAANREIMTQKIDVWVEKLGKFLKRAGDELEKMPARIEKLGGLETILSSIAAIIGVIMAAKIALPFVQLARAIGPLITLVQGIGLAGAAAAAEVIVVVLAIAAHIAVVFLILEDVYTFLTGGDSVLGRIIQNFKDWWAEAGKVKGLLGSMIRMINALSSFVSTLVKFIWGLVSPMLTKIQDAASDVIGSIVAILVDAYASYVKPVIDKIFGKISSMADGVIGTITKILDTMTSIFSGAESGILNFDTIVQMVLDGIKAKIMSVIGGFADLGSLASKIPGIGGILAPMANAATKAVSGMAQATLGGSSSSSQSVVINSPSTINVNGVGEPTTTAAVIDRKQGNRDAANMRQARAAFSGGER